MTPYHFTRCLLALLLACLLTACASPAGDSGAATALDRAGAEATAIIERAQATAVVLQAQWMATALVRQAGEIPVSPTVSPVARVASGSATDMPIAESSAAGRTLSPTAVPVASTSVDAVEVTRVGFAIEGGFIDIQFKAPYEVSEHWWQGSAYLLDEGTGIYYREIPVMPKLGPLISRPKTARQTGYIMLVNGPRPLKPGALVTVVLGAYRFEHLQVQ